VAVIAHLNKAVGMAAGQRIMGGAAWRNAPRLVPLVGAPPGQDIRETGDRVVAVEKTNLGAYPRAQAFRIAPSPDDTSRAILEWGQEVEGIRADDLVRPALSDEETSDREDACDLLREALADGPRIGKVVEAEIVKRAVSARTLRRARRDLGITRGAGTVYQAVAHGPWLWSLQEGPETKPGNTPENSGGQRVTEVGHLTPGGGGWPPDSNPLASGVPGMRKTPEPGSGGHTPEAGHVTPCALPAGVHDNAADHTGTGPRRVCVRCGEAWQGAGTVCNACLDGGA
jgi:hypothetical protein